MIAGGLTAEALGLGEWAQAALPVALLVTTGGLGFGWLSRRFERQCDVIGAWAVGTELDPPGGDPPGDAGAIRPEGAALFARALERIAALNGIPARQRNWRHGSIASRVSYILWMGATRGSRATIDRTVRRIKRGLWLLLAAAVAATVLVEILRPAGP
jgi:STE24 endopeptidase